jgi:hypothetical protein
MYGFLTLVGLVVTGALFLTFLLVLITNISFFYASELFPLMIVLLIVIAIILLLILFFARDSKRFWNWPVSFTILSLTLFPVPIRYAILAQDFAKPFENIKVELCGYEVANNSLNVPEAIVCNIQYTNETGVNFGTLVGELNFYENGDLVVTYTIEAYMCEEDGAIFTENYRLDKNEDLLYVDYDDLAIVYTFRYIETNDYKELNFDPVEVVLK